MASSNAQTAPIESGQGRAESERPEVTHMHWLPNNGKFYTRSTCTARTSALYWALKATNSIIPRSVDRRPHCPVNPYSSRLRSQNLGDFRESISQVMAECAFLPLSDQAPMNTDASSAGKSPLDDS